jgi:hypothetical protein
MTMERPLKEHLLVIRDILRKKRLSSKKAQGKSLCSNWKKNIPPG